MSFPFINCTDEGEHKSSLNDFTLKKNNFHVEKLFHSPRNLVKNIIQILVLLKLSPLECPYA